MEKKADQLTDRIKFINADCMDIMAQYPDKYFDLAIVDPPYGIGVDGGAIGSGTATAPKIYKKKSWDNNSASPEYFIELKRVAKNYIIWGANHFVSKIPDADSPHWIIWDKLNEWNIGSDCEVAYTTFNLSIKKIAFRWAGMLQGDMKNKEERIHPTQKPVKLYEWIYHNYAKPEFKILDTHLGSGSNAIAAHNYGIAEFVGIELDPEYYADSIKRFNRVTSQLRMF